MWQPKNLGVRWKEDISSANYKRQTGFTGRFRKRKAKLGEAA